MIISGFPGIGKSHLAKSHVDVLDLDSSLFSKQEYWQVIYINVAKHFSDRGYTVVLSSHKLVRDQLNQREIPYWLIYPNRELKTEYLKRYADRGNTLAFLDLLNANWDNFIIEMEQDPSQLKVELKANQYLSQVIHL